MRRATAIGILCLAAATVHVPRSAWAQEIGSDCTLEEFASIESRAPVPGSRMTWLGRPVLLCPDGTRLRSDSAVVNEARGHVELIGGVRYETEDRRLDSDVADYYESEGRIFARGRVVFRDIVRGSTVRGDTLVHLAATPARPEEQVTVTGNRPSAELPSRTDAREGEEAPAPYLVIGNRLRFLGEDHFWADGAVEVVRDDMEAFADSLAFDREMGQLFLNGNARVLGDADMEGERIRLTMPDDRLESVLVTGNGRVRSTDLDLTSDEIRITLVDEEIQRVVAIQDRPPAQELPADPPDDEPPETTTGPPLEAPEPSAQAAPAPRARAVTEEFVLEADSLDLDSPGGVLRLVHATGRARGESRGRGPGVAIVSPPQADDLAPEDEGLDRVPELTDSDWIEGDEILAYFESVAAGPEEVVDEQVEPEADPGGRYRLERLEARGNARTLYRAPPDDDPAEVEEGAGDNDMRRWSISYVVAREIFIYMLDGEVDRLEAHEEVLGIQLEPERRPPPDGGRAGSSDDEEEG